MWKLKKGCRRWVIVTKRFALKIPSLNSFDSFAEGILNNLSERDFHQLNLPQLCPIIFRIPGGLLNVMPRCECGIWPGWDDKDSVQMFDEWFSEAKKSERSGLLLRIVEMKHDSVGRMPDGRVVAVDYGSPFVKIIS